MSLLVGSAQARANRRYNFQDVLNAAEHSIEVGETSSSISEKFLAELEYAKVFFKAVLRRPYYDGLQQLERDLVKFYEGSGPITNQNMGVIKKVFLQAFGKNYDYQQPYRLEHWIEHLTFNNNGSELIDCLRGNIPFRRINRARQIFELVPDYVKSKYAQVLDKNGRTALHWAVEVFNDESFANLLIESFEEDKRADFVQIRDKNGDTVLLIANRRKRNIAKILQGIPKKDWGRCLSVLDNDGNSVFHNLAEKEKSNDQIVGLLESLSEEDFLNCISFLNNKGNPFSHMLVINEKTPLNALHAINRILASERLSDEMKEAFLKATNNHGENLLHLAQRMKKYELIRRISRLSLINKRHNLGFTPLERAIAFDDDSAINAILIDLKEFDLSPLNRAVISGYKNALKFILDSMPIKDLMKKLLKADETGSFPLRLAALKNNEDLIKIILDKILSENQNKCLAILNDKDVQSLLYIARLKHVKTLINDIFHSKLLFRIARPIFACSIFGSMLGIILAIDGYLHPRGCFQEFF